MPKMCLTINQFKFILNLFRRATKQNEHNEDIGLSNFILCLLIQIVNFSQYFFYAEKKSKQLKFHTFFNKNLFMYVYIYIYICICIYIQRERERQIYSVLGTAIQRGYCYAGIYSCYAKFFAATHFPLVLRRNEATILKNFAKYKKSI